MPLDAKLCYRALRSRDARFDGRIFAGVRTTGVYCRPVCPARTPRRENVQFFPSAAAAADAGFRPCRRCRPETSPLTPAWRGTAATVTRALRLIDEGTLDRGSVADLAARLGVSERHLRRLFDAHLGASPLAVAQTRRVHFAKRLLDETALPITEVAFAAGFGSLRRFNAAMRCATGLPPGELRRASRGRARGGERAAPSVSLRLGFREPFDFDALLSFFETRAIPGVESVEADVYRRSFALAGSAGRGEGGAALRGVIEVRRAARAGQLELRVPAAAGPALLEIAERVRRLFDLGADPAEILPRLRRDPGLAPALRSAPGLRVPGCWDGFELAVRAILGQQISVAGARTLAGRLAERFGTPLRPTAGPIGFLFPQPSQLMEANIEGAGLTRARAHAVRALARSLVAGELLLESPSDLEQAIQRLMALPGIGPWTAQYIAMRALREPDAFPDGDLGLRRALTTNGTPLSARALRERAEAWRPWRAYAAVALWRAS
jgi:AraC family transcriptional regulator of adaptative response / DNA-3-methyladenine glycosylase II